MPKKVTKKVNIAVTGKKQGYWVNEENLHKGERTIKAESGKALVLRYRSGYDYSKEITGYAWTKAELQQKLAERAKKGLIEQQSIARDLAHTHRITKKTPLITAKGFFSREDWYKRDIYGIDSPPGMTLKEIQESYKEETKPPIAEKVLLDSLWILIRRSADKGISSEELRKVSRLSKKDTEKLLTKLLESGDIYEFSRNKFKTIGMREVEEISEQLVEDLKPEVKPKPQISEEYFFFDKDGNDVAMKMGITDVTTKKQADEVSEYLEKLSGEKVVTIKARNIDEAFEKVKPKPTPTKQTKPTKVYPYGTILALERAGVDLSHLYYLSSTGRLNNDYEIMKILGVNKVSDVYDLLREYNRTERKRLEEFTTTKQLKDKNFLNQDHMDQAKKIKNLLETKEPLYKKYKKPEVQEKPISETKIPKPSEKRFIIKNSYADKNIGFTFEGKEVLDFSIINCTPDEEHTLMIDRGYAPGKTEMTRRWTKKGEKLNIFKITTSEGTEYVASLESDPKAYTWKTFGTINKKSFDTITEAKQWLSKKTSIPRKNFTTDKVDLKELENIRPELGIKFDNLRSIKKTADSSEMKDILVKDAESTYNNLISKMNIIEYNTDIAIRDASKPITSKEVINKLLQDAKGRKETLETQSEWIGDDNYQRRRAYEKERLPIIIKALKEKGKYPELPDSHKFRSNAQLQEEYYLTLLFDPDFKKGEMQIAKMKDEIPKSEIELLKAQNITHRYTLNEQFDKAKKPENKNAKFVKDLIAEEKKIFQSYVDGRSENAIENAENYNKRTKINSIEKQKQHISYLKQLYDSEDITEAYEYRQKQNERTPEGQYNRVNRLGNDLRALGEEATDLQNNVKNQKEYRNKKGSFDRGMGKLTAAQKEKDLSETADITIQAVNEETFEVWEKQPFLLDMKGYDDVEGQEPPPRFTLTKAKKYLKELGADPDKLELSEYGTISYAGKRIGSIDTRAPRSEQLRREIVRGVSWGDIPVKEMKRKVILNKKEKALLNSLGDYTPSAKELDDYLTGDIAETKKFLKQLEEKGLIKRNKDNTYSTTDDGRKIQQMMNKLPTPIKPKEIVKPPSQAKTTKQAPSQDEITKQDFYSMGIRSQNAMIKKNIHRLYYEKYGEKCNISVVGSTGTATGNINLRGTTDQENDFLWKELKIGPIVLYGSKRFWMNKLSTEGKLQEEKKEPVKKEEQ